MQGNRCCEMRIILERTWWLKEEMIEAGVIKCKHSIAHFCECIINTKNNQLFYLPVWPSVQFSHSVMSDSLWPHESQHARPPCPSPNPGVHSNSCPSSWWSHPAISSSVVPFSSCPQSLPASVFSNKSTLGMRWPKYWKIRSQGSQINTFFFYSLPFILICLVPFFFSLFEPFEFGLL